MLRAERLWRVFGLVLCKQHARALARARLVGRTLGLLQAVRVLEVADLERQVERRVAIPPIPSRRADDQVRLLPGGDEQSRTFGRSLLACEHQRRDGIAGVARLHRERLPAAGLQQHAHRIVLPHLTREHQRRENDIARRRASGVIGINLRLQQQPQARRSVVAAAEYGGTRSPSAERLRPCRQFDHLLWVGPVGQQRGHLAEVAHKARLDERGCRRACGKIIVLQRAHQPAARDPHAQPPCWGRLAAAVEHATSR